MPYLSRILPGLALLLLSVPASSTELQGRVVGIADGDTLTLLDASRQQHKIRLAAIDAPEAHQPFGQKAKMNLSSLAFNKEVIATCTKADRYGRMICKVAINGVDINLEQVKAGMAWHYTLYAREQSPQDREDYEVAEFNAKIRRFGLWNDKNPVPPWEWRKR